MYLATFGGDGEEILLGLAAMPSAPASGAWWAMYHDLVRHLGSVGWCGASLRVVVSAEGSVRQLLTMAAPTRREPQLRRFLATFSRLATLTGGTVVLPSARDEFDELLDDMPPARLRVPRPVDVVGDGAWVACDFRIAPSLASMIDEARAFDYTVGYQANLVAVSGRDDWAKEARKNLLRLGDVAGVPSALLSRQRVLADSVAMNVAVVDEYVAVDEGAAEEWLADFVTQRFDNEFASCHVEAPTCETKLNAYSEELAVGAVADASSISAADAAASGIGPATLAAVFGWQPSPAVIARLPSPPMEAGDGEMIAPLIPPDAPAAYEGAGPFAFVSYKRADLARIGPLVAGLQQRGLNLWYDRGIPGGAEWNALLEARLDTCAGLVFFLTQAAVDSRFVRRELLYADGLGKPIITVQLEPAHLHSGLGLQLQQVQILNGLQPDLLDQLNEAMRFAR